LLKKAERPESSFFVRLSRTKNHQRFQILSVRAARQSNGAADESAPWIDEIS